ncbi:unnamed protein product [Soboliphyme baturini]|uniref:Uncharacterized protein n=1 Tax=Soboliphyme baturini TaxID=241478 RepID=A0A183ITK8_9BILA|nr:unnamed protein product [Soboliphyme baturini]
MSPNSSTKLRKDSRKVFRKRHIGRSVKSYWQHDSTYTESQETSPKICIQSPLLITNQVNPEHDRTLCPWKWKVNRNHRRKPPLLSEAVCLCRYARGFRMARCMPILREIDVQVLVDDPVAEKAIYIDTQEIISVGCNAVVPNIRLAQQFIPSPIWQDMQ